MMEIPVENINVGLTEKKGQVLSTSFYQQQIKNVKVAKSKRSNFKREERGNKEYSQSSRGLRSPSFSRDNDRKRDNNERKRFNDEKNWRHNDKGDFLNDAKPRRPDSNSRRGYSPAASNKSDNYKQSSPTNPDNYKQSRNVPRVANPALYTTPFNSHELENRSVNVSVCWFHNPSHFYCQLNDQQTEFEAMMNEIQNTYSDIKPEKNVPVGSSVIALFPEDNILYRARILNSQGSQYRVQYIDFGNVSTTDKVWPVEKKFMDLPAQAVYCCLNGILPCDTDWPDADVFSAYFNKECFTCNIVYKENDQHKVDLICDDKYVNQMLVEANLARYEDVGPTIELPILLGQQIRVLLMDVQSLDSILVQLELGCIISCSMHNLSTATDIQEQTLKDNINNYLIMYVDNVLEAQLEVTFYDVMGSKLQIIEPDEGAFSSIEPICMYPVYYSNIIGRVVYLTQVEEKYQLCIQFDENFDAINHLLDGLFTHYNNSVIETPVIPQVGTIYAVLSSDTNWYRGEVISIENETANILFIDYGNSENVEIQNLRTLDDKFKSQHMLCLKVLTSTFVDGQILEEEITGEIYFEDNWEIVLHTIAGVPVEAAPVEEQITTEVVHELVPGGEETAPEESLSKGYSVILSHFDTPNEFYLQFTNEIEKIEDLLSTIQEQVNEWPNLDNPAAGILCAAPFSVDQQWYRALILDADSDITTVRFLDYGNTDVIDNSVTVLKTLPSELLAITQYAQRYSLLVKPTDVEWSQTACEKFEELTKSDNLFVDIQHQDEKYTYVELYSNEVNVADALLQDKLVQKFEIETSKSGYLSHLNSPSEFWIQFENTVADLEWVADQLASVDKFPEVEDMTPGSLCVALFPDDEMWYRARILSNTVAGIEVLFIDYGNSCLCTGLKQLPEDMIMLPPLAQKCSLQKPNGILQWSDRAIEEFKTLSADGATVFNIHKISTGETSVVKLLLEGEDIISKLLPITEDSYIIHFESISSFWIHLTSNEQKLESISKLLELAPELQKYEDGQISNDIVVALFPDDEQWYRAQILNVNESEYEVLFIDYGNGSIVTDVRIASDEIKQEKPLAYLCKVEPLPGFCWVEGSSLALSDISNDGNTVFQVEFVNNNVVRLYINGSDIRMQLPSETLSSAHNTPKKRAIKPVEDELNLDEVNHVTDEIIESVPIETDENNKQLEHSNIVDDQDTTITSTDDIQDFSNIKEDIPNIDETTAANDLNEEVVYEITDNVSDVNVLQEDNINSLVNDASEVVVSEIMEDLINVRVSYEGKSTTDEFASDMNEAVVSEVMKDLVVSSEESQQDKSITDELSSDINEIVVEPAVMKDVVVSNEVLSNQDKFTTDELASDTNEAVVCEVMTELVVSSEVSNQDKSITDELASDIKEIVVEPEIVKDVVVSSEVLSNQDICITDELASDTNEAIVSEVTKDLVVSSEESKQDKSIIDELASDINEIVVEPEIMKDVVFPSELLSNQDKFITDDLDTKEVVESEFTKDLVVPSEVANQDDFISDSIEADLTRLKDIIDVEVSRQNELTDDVPNVDAFDEVLPVLDIEEMIDTDVAHLDNSTNDSLVLDASEDKSKIAQDFINIDESKQDTSISDSLVNDENKEAVCEKENLDHDVSQVEVNDVIATVVPENIEELKDIELSKQEESTTDSLHNDEVKNVASAITEDFLDIEISKQDESYFNKLYNDEIPDVPGVKSNLRDTDLLKQEAIITDNGALINVNLEEKSCGTEIKEPMTEEQKISSSTEKPSNEIDQTPKMYSEKIVVESSSKGDLSEIKSNEQVEGSGKNV